MRKVRVPIGRPRYEADKDELMELYKKYRSVRDMAKVLGVSYSTVHRRLREYGIELAKWVYPDWIKMP